MLNIKFRYAEDMLKQHAANSGDFIVRESQKLGGYCISVLVSKDGECVCVCVCVCVC